MQPPYYSNGFCDEKWDIWLVDGETGAGDGVSLALLETAGEART